MTKYRIFIHVGYSRDYAVLSNKFLVNCLSSEYFLQQSTLSPFNPFNQLVYYASVVCALSSTTASPMHKHFMHPIYEKHILFWQNYLRSPPMVLPWWWRPWHEEASKTPVIPTRWQVKIPHWMTLYSNQLSWTSSELHYAFMLPHQWRHNWICYQY